MKVFLSYSTPDRDRAEEIALALDAQGHDVFFDRTDLEGGADYNTVIRRHLEQAQLLIFLISPSSVRPGSYALTELKLARARWPHPGRHVLPVVVHPTELESIPRYLRSVTLFEPEGNVAAEVVAHVNAAVRRRSRRRNATAAAMVVVVAMVIGVWQVQDYLSSPEWTVNPEDFITRYVYPEGVIEREAYLLDPTFELGGRSDDVLEVTRLAYGSILDQAPAVSVTVGFRNTTDQPMNLDFDSRFFSLVDDQGRKGTLLYFCCESGTELLNPGGRREMHLIYGANPGWSGKEVQAHRLLLHVNGLLPVASATWTVPTLATAQ